MQGYVYLPLTLEVIETLPEVTTKTLFCKEFDIEKLELRRNRMRRRSASNFLEGLPNTAVSNSGYYMARDADNKPSMVIYAAAYAMGPGLATFFRLLPVNAEGNYLGLEQTQMDINEGNELASSWMGSQVTPWANEVKEPRDTVLAGYWALDHGDSNDLDPWVSRSATLMFETMVPGAPSKNRICELLGLAVGDARQAKVANCAYRPFLEILMHPINLACHAFVLKAISERIKQLKLLAKQGDSKELEELSIKKSVERTNSLVEAIRLLHMQKSAIETVINGITKNTLTKASVDNLGSSMSELQSAKQETLSKLRKHLVKE